MTCTHLGQFSTHPFNRISKRTNFLEKLPPVQSTNHRKIIRAVNTRNTETGKHLGVCTNWQMQKTTLRKIRGRYSLLCRVSWIWSSRLTVPLLLPEKERPGEETPARMDGEPRRVRVLPPANLITITTRTWSRSQSHSFHQDQKESLFTTHSFQAQLSGRGTVKSILLMGTCCQYLALQVAKHQAPILLTTTSLILLLIVLAIKVMSRAEQIVRQKHRLPYFFVRTILGRQVIVLEDIMRPGIRLRLQDRLPPQFESCNSPRLAQHESGKQCKFPPAARLNSKLFGLLIFLHPRTRKYISLGRGLEPMLLAAGSS